MTRIAARDGYEVWCHFDSTAQVYELFASDTGGDYIGCADTLHEARSFASEWIAEQVGY